MNAGWSVYIIVLTLGNILACLWLLWWTSKRRPDEKAEDTTGHVWDGDLREYNNPLPRWWLMLFYLTVFFSLGYLVLYPGLGNFKGTLGWTQVKEYTEESARIEARQQEVFAQFNGMELPALAANEEARGIGSRIFANNCAVCHGADARGAPGFPNLADNDWLYGGEPEQIMTSIRNGRSGMMPDLTTGLGEQGVAEVAAFVYQLNGREPYADTASMVDAGKQKFGTFCAACHGPGATGNTAMGAPNLTDDTWLYGGSFETIRKTVMDGRNGRMPSHASLLNDDEIRLVAAYVYGLSQKEKE